MAPPMSRPVMPVPTGSRTPGAQASAPGEEKTQRSRPGQFALALSGARRGGGSRAGCPCHMPPANMWSGNYLALVTVTSMT